MFTITITLKGTQEKIVLLFKTLEGAQNCASAIRDNPAAIKADDFGQCAYFDAQNIITLVMSDVAAHWRGRNKISFAGLYAELEFNIDLGKDPTLRDLAGGVRPNWGGKS